MKKMATKEYWQGFKAAVEKEQRMEALLVQAQRRVAELESALGEAAYMFAINKWSLDEDLSPGERRIRDALPWPHEQGAMNAN